MKKLKITLPLAMFVPLAALVVVLLAPAFTPAAQAQGATGGVRITYPQEGMVVRGEITVRFEGVPEGGYVQIRIDDAKRPRLATAQSSFVLNTFDPLAFADPDDRTTVKASTEGPHRISITAINPAGKQVGTAQVSFIVGNETVAPPSEAPGVTLRHWIPTDILGDVQRYRVFAESNASIEEPQGAGGGGGGGGAGGEADWTPAPLDWQVSALARRVLRDVGMIDGSANIRTVIQQAFQRQRLSEAGDAGSGEGGAGGSSGAKKSKLKGVGKAPWNQTDAGVPLWDPAPETGQYFVKMVQPSGAEINATRKEPTIALADLLPLFPVQEVRPGSGWDTRMVIVAELSSVPRQSFKLENARIRFTNFENVMTPAGHSRRAAKLESYYQLPDNVAKRVAAILSINGGGGSGGGAAGGGGGSEGGSGGGAAAGGATDAEAQEEAIQEAMAEILVARTRGSRLVWFDIDRRLVLRSEDVIDTYYELEGAAAGGATGSSAALMSPALTIRSSAQMGMGRSGMPGPGMPGMMGPGAGGAPGGDAAAAPAEPTIVRYNLRIVTQYDDRVPAPSDAYTAGAMTPNSNWPWNPDYFPAERRPNNRDKSLVRNPTIQRVLPPKPAP